jgi:hypothetical protein
MSVATRVVSEIAAEMGLVPLVWVVALRFRGRAIGAAWYWLAAAFAVSWLADTAALIVDPDLVGNLYPITQAALIGAVLLDRLEAAQFVVALVFVGVGSVLWHGVAGPDVLLRTVAWGAVTLIVWRLPLPGRLRASLLVTFGLGWACWMAYAANPGWPSWSVYQTTRLVGTALFCLAASNPTPKLRIARRDA